MKRYCILLCLLLMLSAASCDNDGSPEGAAEAIEKYLRVKVEEKDADKLATLACAAWESEVGKDAKSLRDIETTLTEISCETAGTEGEHTLVECTGSIDAVYPGGDNRTLDPGGTYRARQEGGEWKMCGGPE